MAVLLTALAVTGPLHAQPATPAVTFEALRCEPCVPERVRQQAVLEKARADSRPARTLPGAASDRLKSRFDAADVRKAGRLTPAEALAGGFGFIAQHFDAIDRQRRGDVSFDELTTFLKSRGAILD